MKKKNFVNISSELFLIIFSLPCKGAKFVLQKLKQNYNFEAEIIYLNAGNKEEIYLKYNLDNTKIPSVFIGDKLISYGKIVESDLKDEFEKFLKENNQLI